MIAVKMWFNNYIYIYLQQILLRYCQYNRKMPHRSDFKRQDSEEVFTADMIQQQTVKQHM